MKRLALVFAVMYSTLAFPSAAQQLSMRGLAGWGFDGDHRAALGGVAGLSIPVLRGKLRGRSWDVFLGGRFVYYTGQRRATFDPERQRVTTYRVRHIIPTGILGLTLPFEHVQFQVVAEFGVSKRNTSDAPAAFALLLERTDPAGGPGLLVAWRGRSLRIGLEATYSIVGGKRPDVFALYSTLGIVLPP